MNNDDKISVLVKLAGLGSAIEVIVQGGILIPQR